MSLSLISDIQSRVRWILERFEHSRNYDENEFLFCYWRVWEGYGTSNLSGKGLTSHESISRCKRKLVEENPHYKSDPHIRKAKQAKEEQFRSWAKR